MSKIERFLFVAVLMLLVYSSFLLGQQFSSVGNIKWLFSPPIFDTPTNESRLKPDLVLDLINGYRKTNGLEPFIANKQLEYVAYLRANHIVDTGEFSHQASNNSSYEDFIKKFAFRFSRYGENLGIGFANEEKLINAWMLSQSHRELILGDYVYAGVHTAEEYSVLIVGK